MSDMPLLYLRMSGYHRTGTENSFRSFIRPSSQKYQPHSSICWTWLIRWNPCRGSAGAWGKRKNRWFFASGIKAYDFGSGSYMSSHTWNISQGISCAENLFLLGQCCLYNFCDHVMLLDLLCEGKDIKCIDTV